MWTRSPSPAPRDRPQDPRRRRAHIKKVTLELGGKSANIVCPDADSTSLSTGRSSAPSSPGPDVRVGHASFVHDDIYDTFVDRLVDGAASLRVGDAADFDTQVGR